MKLTLEEADEFLTLPSDELIQLSVASIETRDVAGRDGKDGWTSLNFKFNIIGLPSRLEPEYTPLLGGPIWGSVSARLTTHPDNKLRKWVEALLGVGELEEGFELDTEILIGRKARGQIGTYTKRDSTQLQHKIVGLLPFNPEPAFAGFSATYGDDEPPF